MSLANITINLPFITSLLAIPHPNPFRDSLIATVSKPNPLISAKITLSRSLLDLGEYTRLSSILSSPFGGPMEGLDDLGLWLWGYGAYMGGEKRKEEQIGETPGEQRGDMPRSERCS